MIRLNSYHSLQRYAFILFIFTMVLLIIQYNFMSTMRQYPLLRPAQGPRGMSDQTNAPSQVGISIESLIRAESPCYRQSVKNYNGHFLQPDCWSRVTKQNRDRKSTLSADDLLCALETIRPRPVKRRKKTFVIIGVGVHKGPSANEGHAIPCAGFEYISWSPHDTKYQFNISQFLFASYSQATLKEAQRAFWDAYKNNVDLRRADAVICGFDTWQCLIFAPFNKKLIFNHVYRFEGHRAMTRQNTRDFQRLMYDVVRYNPDTLLAGGNVYDVIYAQHFLGSHKIIPLLADCEYVHARLKKETAGGECPGIDNSTLGYHPNKDEISMFPKRLTDGGRTASKLVRDYLKKKGVSYELSVAEEIAGRYKYCDLGIYPAVVMFPYSVMSYFCCESAAMAIPMFMPSPRLYAAWERDYHVVNERKGDFTQRDVDFMTQSVRSLNFGFNPNNDFNMRSLERWLAYADMYYQGAETFDSLEELYEKIEAGKFQQTYDRLVHHRVNNVVRTQLHWQAVYRYFFGNGDAEDRDIQFPNTFDEGMKLWHSKTRRPDLACSVGDTTSQNADDKRKWLLFEMSTLKKQPQCKTAGDRKVVVFDFFSLVNDNPSLEFCEVVIMKDLRSTHTLLDELTEEITSRYPYWQDSSHLKQLLMTSYAILKGAQALTILSPDRNPKAECRVPSKLKYFINYRQEWRHTYYDKNMFWLAWLPLSKQIADTWLRSMTKFSDEAIVAKSNEITCLNTFENEDLKFPQRELDYFADYLKNWTTDEEHNFLHLLDQNLFELAVKGYVMTDDVRLYRVFLHVLARSGHGWYVSDHVYTRNWR